MEFSRSTPAEESSPKEGQQSGYQCSHADPMHYTTKTYMACTKGRTLLKSTVHFTS